MMMQPAVTMQPVVTVQPAPYSPPHSPRQEPWGSTIFDCFENMSVCCLGFWCPGCLMCSIAQEMEEGFLLPLVDIFCPTVAGSLCIPGITLCLPLAISPIALALRVAMRERYHIKGSVADDCLATTFCNVCAWCQMAREIRLRRRPVINNTQVNILNMPPQFPVAPVVAAVPTVVAAVPPMVALTTQVSVVTSQ